MTILKEESSSTGLECKNTQSTCCKKFIALKAQIPCGPQNGDIGQFLVGKIAVSVGLPFCLTTPLALISENFSLTQMVDLLFATLKQNRNVLLWPHCTRLMLMTRVFF